MEIHHYGADSLLVDVAGPAEALALYRAARRRGVRARDIVPAASSVLFDRPDDLDGLVSELPGLPGLAPVSLSAEDARTVEVPTDYSGPDLATVARHWGMSVDEAVRTHCSAELVVAFCGFAPGFAYCTGLPPTLRVPRLTDPRPRVEPGSVALADGYTAIYPTASPGGWQVIGRTDLTLWDATRAEPATLAPGTRVRFVAV